jgi:hypothetical protein
MGKFFTAVLMALVLFTYGCHSVGTTDSPQRAFASTLATPEPALSAVVLVVDGQKLVINLPERWSVELKPFDTPWGRGVRIRDRDGVANLAIFLDRTKNTLRRVMNIATRHFMEWYTGFGHNFVAYASEAREREIVVVGHNGILREYSPLLDGKPRRVDIAVFPVTYDHVAIVCVYNNKREFSDPKTPEVVLTNLSFEPAG